jgi:transposase
LSDLLMLTPSQMRRIEPYFPLSHGIPRVDDRRVLSGILFVIRNGLAGAMSLPATVHTRPFTTASSAGADWVCSIGSSPNWPRGAARRTI